MKAVISGKIYDTDTGTKICDHDDGSTSDFQFYRSELYRSPRGRFFLAGRGGPMSRWAKAADMQGGRIGGSGIILLDRDEARSICEQEGVSIERMRECFQVEEG